MKKKYDCVSFSLNFLAIVGNDYERRGSGGVHIEILRLNCFPDTEVERDIPGRKTKPQTQGQKALHLELAFIT